MASKAGEDDDVAIKTRSCNFVQAGRALACGRGRAFAVWPDGAGDQVLKVRAEIRPVGGSPESKDVIPGQVYTEPFEALALTILEGSSTYRVVVAIAETEQDQITPPPPREAGALSSVLLPNEYVQSFMANGAGVVATPTPAAPGVSWGGPEAYYVPLPPPAFSYAPRGLDSIGIRAFAVSIGIDRISRAAAAFVPNGAERLQCYVWGNCNTNPTPEPVSPEDPYEWSDDPSTLQGTAAFQPGWQRYPGGDISLGLAAPVSGFYYCGEVTVTMAEGGRLYVPEGFTLTPNDSMWIRIRSLQ